jgi:hypothetical protein
VHDLIFRMVAENPIWGAPGCYGELLMLASISPNAAYR